MLYAKIRLGQATTKASQHLSLSGTGQLDLRYRTSVLYIKPMPIQYTFRYMYDCTEVCDLPMWGAFFTVLLRTVHAAIVNASPGFLNAIKPRITNLATNGVTSTVVLVLSYSSTPLPGYSTPRYNVYSTHYKYLRCRFLISPRTIVLIWNLDHKFRSIGHSGL